MPEICSKILRRCALIRRISLQITSGFVLRTRTDALSNLRVRTAGVRAAYGAVRSDYPEVVGPPGSRNNPLHLYLHTDEKLGELGFGDPRLGEPLCY